MNSIFIQVIKVLGNYLPCGLPALKRSRFLSCQVILIILISLLNPGLLFSKEIILKSEDQFSFARQYMLKGEYSRAIAEFERFIYFFPDDEKVPRIRNLIGLCHLEGKQYQKARKVFKDIITDYPGTIIAEKALFLTGETYYRQGLSSKAETFFKQIVELHPKSEFRDEALYRLGWTGLKSGRWHDASDNFSSIESDSPIYPHSMDLAQRALQGEGLPHRDPKAAGLMAGIVPGLGHAYCNRYRDGLVAFLLNGLFIWATAESFEEDHDVLGGILCFFEAGWYTGNIYSAVNSAHKFNRNEREKFIRGLPDSLDLDLFTSRTSHLGIALRIEF